MLYGWIANPELQSADCKPALTHGDEIYSGITKSKSIISCLSIHVDKHALSEATFGWFSESMLYV
jgi:hypothetical protein